MVNKINSSTIDILKEFMENKSCKLNFSDVKAETV